MAAKCSVCGITEVLFDGNVCEFCSIAQDHYATQNAKANAAAQQPTPSSPSLPGSSKSRGILLNGGGTANTSISPVSASTYVAPAQQASAPVQTASFAPVTTVVSGVPAKVKPVKASTKVPVTAGITKNVNTDRVKRSALFKWFRAVFTSIPFTTDNDVTTFQVFPDYSGQSLNASGCACDQVVIYGKVPLGFISENNDVEVYGKRDGKGNVIATKIKNTASGTTVKAHKSLNALAVKLITLFVLAVICVYIAFLFSVVDAGSISAQDVTKALLEGIFSLIIIIIIIRRPRIILDFFRLIFSLIFGYRRW